MTNSSDPNISAQSLRLYASKYGLHFVDSLADYTYVRKKVQLIPYHFAKEKSILPLAEQEDKILVAVCHPEQMIVLDELRFLLQKPVEEVLTTKEQLEKAIDECYRQGEQEATDYIQTLSNEDKGAGKGDLDGEYDLLDQSDGSSVIKLLNIILLEALQQEASDIHFEPTETGLLVRYRVDGVLQTRHRPPKELQQQLLTRIKVIAKLDIAEHRMPQDGRIKLKRGGNDVDFRVSTLPVVYGERIVLRILDKGNIRLSLDDICMAPTLLKSYRSTIRQNQGIILVTGPTGSGKTTTLYSSILDIHSSDINIMTIEDPVEYKLDKIAQIGVNPKIGLTFSRGLRHILRQDPDVVLVGEIRDKETAEIAIQASLTGHLVLSTLHTNDAPSAITRLIDMGIEPYLISSSLIAVLGQRLVRKICHQCSTSYTPSEEELKELGCSGNAPLFYRGEGCENCFGVGYKGRQALYEFLDVTNPIKQQLLLNPDASQLQQVALKQNMVTMRRAGIELVKSGITTSAEVLRVTRLIDTT